MIPAVRLDSNRACPYGKVTFANKSHCKQMARRVFKLFGKKVKHYRCLSCGKFHVFTMRSDTRKGSHEALHAEREERRV
jgi:hypothetical protein